MRVYYKKKKRFPCLSVVNLKCMCNKCMLVLFKATILALGFVSFQKNQYYHSSQNDEYYFFYLRNTASSPMMGTNLNQVCYSFCQICCLHKVFKYVNNDRKRQEHGQKPSKNRKMREFMLTANKNEHIQLYRVFNECEWLLDFKAISNENKRI